MTFAGGAQKLKGENLKAVFHYKFGCFDDVYAFNHCGQTTTSIVENLTQVKSCWLSLFMGSIK
jgi:hypothetical protein